MEKIFGIIIAALLVLCFVLISDNDTKKLEVLKVWGIDNYNKLVELYESDIYKEQQANAIMQFEAQMQQLANPIIEEQPTEE